MIIDLTKAQFFGALGNWANEYGQYDFPTSAIITKTGWPDWYIPYVLDPTTTYTIRFKYDPLNVHDTGGRGLWITGLRPGHLREDYDAPGHFGEIWNNDDSSTADDHTITVGPGLSNWDDPTYGPAQGYTVMLFESNHVGALNYLEITPDPLPLDPTTLVPWPEDVALVNGHNQNVSDPGGAGADQPYFSRYWTLINDTTEDITLDTQASQAVDLTAADTQIYVFRGPDFENPNFVAFNDDANIAPNTLLSQVTFHCVAGIEYHIRVGTYDNTGDGVTLFDLNAPFTGTNSGGGGGGGGPHAPDPPDPEAAFFLTEIVSTLAPASGKIAASYVWTQVSPGSPVLVLHPDHGTLRFINPPVQADTDFVVRLTVTDNLGGTQTEDHTVHVKAHNYWALSGGQAHGIQTVRSFEPGLTQFRFTRSTHDLIAPYTYVQVYDQDGWLATFTTGARSVLLRRKTPTAASIPTDAFTTTFTTDQRVLLLPAPFDGTVDEVLLAEMYDNDEMDLFDYLQALVSETVVTVNGVQISKANTYDAVADWNDFLGLDFSGDTALSGKSGKISAEGFVRLVFGPTGLGMNPASIPTTAAAMAVPGAPGTQIIDPEVYVPSGTFESYLQMGDVLGFVHEKTGEHHVGIYLGRDALFTRRFISSRSDSNGISASDNGVTVWSRIEPYTLPVQLKYSGWFRSARRY